MSGESAAGWSHTSDLASEEASPVLLSTSEGERYRIDDIVGAGGMGTVFSAWDHRLSREVALKRISGRDGDAAATQRLAREAEITANLEHPGIVPVYDAGEDSSGRVFYTMRLIRGQSLADALTSMDHSALLRHFLGACHAVAYAHSRGVIHRDLKPANIMVGEFGETHVVDWGLAAHLDSHSPRQGAGTKGYISPDTQPTLRSDVWSLGAVLRDIAAGPDLSEDEEQDRRARHPELNAIIDKAMAPDARDRYADAGSLADDVALFLDGKRVEAHDYTASEILQRLVRAWKVPLLVAAIALTTLAVIGVTAWWKVRGERNRAVVAERETSSALANRSETLAWALRQHSVSLHAFGAGPEAEVVASRALGLEESADSRGVLVSTRSGWRPSLASGGKLPPCDIVQLVDQQRLLCVNDETLELWTDGGEAPLWTTRIATRSVSATPDVAVVFTKTFSIELVSLADGNVFGKRELQSARLGLQISSDHRWLAMSNGRHLDMTRLDTAQARERIHPCSDDAISAIGMGRRHLAIVCETGQLLWMDVETMVPTSTQQIPFSVDDSPAFAVAVAVDDSAIAIANIQGKAIEVDPSRGTHSAPVSIARGPVTLAFLSDVLVVVPQGGVAALWNLRAGIELSRLPANSRNVTVTGDAISASRNGKREWWTFRPPEAAQIFRAPAGLSSVAIDPEGAWLAAGRGDGTVTIWSTGGDLIRELRIGRDVIKGVDISRDGRLLAVAVADVPGVVVFDTSDWSRSSFDEESGFRRIGFSSEGGILALPYRGGFVSFDKGKVVDASPGINFIDGDISPERQLLLNSKGEVVAVNGDGVIETIVVDRDAVAICNAGQHGVAIAHRTKVVLHPPDGKPPMTFDSVSERLHDVIVDGSGRYLLAGSIDGIIEVWSVESGDLVARLRGHDERVAHLQGGHDGSVYSASWDGTVRRWDLTALELDASSLEADAALVWAVSMESALDGAAF